MLRASSLPALAQCPCFESGNTELDQERTGPGQDRHKALELHFKGDQSMLNLLDDEDREGVMWAGEYIKLHANKPENIRWETGVIAELQDFTEIPGTPDAVETLDIFDLKWRQFDYSAQMAAYALAVLQNRGTGTPAPQVRVHLLFACFKRAQVLTFDEASATAMLEKIVTAYKDPNKQPSPCTYCGWCAKQITCPAVNERAQAVAQGRDDWKLDSYHASEITRPGEMAKALRLARQVEKWAKAVQHHAKEMALKQGVTIPGFELKSKKGRTSVADVTGAFQTLGLPAAEFLQCCDLRLNTSKQNPAKKGLIDVYKTAKEIDSKTAAKKEVTNKLQQFCRTPKEVLYLQAVGETDEESTEE
jgi:hypothetical protein